MMYTLTIWANGTYMQVERYDDLAQAKNEAMELVDMYLEDGYKRVTFEITADDDEVIDYGTERTMGI